MCQCLTRPHCSPRQRIMSPSSLGESVPGACIAAKMFHPDPQYRRGYCYLCCLIIVTMGGRKVVPFNLRMRHETTAQAWKRLAERTKNPCDACSGFATSLFDSLDCPAVFFIQTRDCHFGIPGVIGSHSRASSIGGYPRDVRTGTF